MTLEVKKAQGSKITREDGEHLEDLARVDKK